MFIQPFLSQKLVDLVQGHHYLYTNLEKWSSLKSLEGALLSSHLFSMQPKPGNQVLLLFKWWRLVDDLRLMVLAVHESKFQISMIDKTVRICWR